MRRIFLTLALMASLGQPGLAANPAPDETLAEDQSFAFWIPDEVGPLDPALNGSETGATVLRQLFEGLMMDGTDGGMRPGMAVGHEVSADGLVHRFHLRAALWSDGRPVVADDFVRGWRRVADPATGSPHGWYLAMMGVAGARAVLAGTAAPEDLGIAALDDSTLRVTLTAPRADLPAMLSHPATYPAPPEMGEDRADAGAAPVGNGAFMVASHDLGVALRMVPNPRYWDADSVVLTDLRAVTINDETAALRAYRAGDLDRVILPAGQMTAQISAAPEDVTVLPRACTYAFVLNLSAEGPEALKDARVRRALQLGFDRDLVVDQLLQGGQRPAWGWLPPALSGAVDSPDIATLDQKARVEQAKALLDEAGYRPGRPLRLVLRYNTGEDHKAIALAARDFWQPLGVHLTLAHSDWKTHEARLRKGDFEIARYGWCADYNAPAAFLDWFAPAGPEGANPGGWQHADYARLLSEARNADDPTPAYRQAQAILARETPVVTIYHYADAALVRPQIKGLPRGGAALGRWSGKDLYRLAD